MNRGMRHGVQRARRAALKADAAFLLDRIAALMTSHQIDGKGDRLRLEIAEMRLRLSPPRGVKAPTIFTNYTQRGLTRKTED